MIIRSGRRFEHKEELGQSSVASQLVQNILVSFNKLVNKSRAMRLQKSQLKNCVCYFQIIWQICWYFAFDISILDI